MKKQYNILSLILVLSLGSFAYADEPKNNLKTESGKTLASNEGGITPKADAKSNGIIAFGGGGGLRPDPQSTQSIETFCFLGFCLSANP